MVTITLDPELERRLEALAKKAGRTKDDFAREAILRLIEDEDDYRQAILELDRAEPRVTLDEMKKRLGMDH